LTVSHVLASCVHTASGFVPGGSTLRLAVEATAPKPHRDGDIQASCSTPTFPAIGITPPVSTICSITDMNSRTRVVSEVRTTAEIIRPIVIDAIASTAVASTSSIQELPNNDPWAG